MRIEITSDPVEFRARVAGFLERDPLRHTVMCTVVENEITGLTVTEELSYFASVHEGDEVIGVAMRTAGRGVWLGEVPERAIPELVERFAELLPEIRDVDGSESAALAFAQGWARLHGTTPRQVLAERLYRLGELRIPRAPGAPRRATEADLELCGRWVAAMARELEAFHLGLSESALRARIRAGRWWLWEDDGRPVSLTAHQIPLRGWARIGPVYTPPETRAHGYASALVAHVAQVIRDLGADVCLYTELGNPTSNKIYQAIGFEPVLDQIMYAFD
ncbi:GNAT family N-acetyltransferase [Nocardia concava]|uniref:GNAT family N-acetyltransferase n=1 Tax=Nocardia concava TaxID=257281 RepID=UPI0002F62BDE|nr:GNAT family N-acetyltransferase [Nocardia concava]